MINTFIQTYIKDKTKLTLYKNNIPIEKDILPYGINIFDVPQSDITDIEEFYIIKFLNLISTNIGERIMYPDYGVDFDIYVFNNSTNVILSGLKNELQQKLKEYIPEIEIKNVSINLFDPDNHELELNFSLLIKPINTITNLNYNVS